MKCLDQEQSWKQDHGSCALNLLLITAPEMNEAFLQPPAGAAQGWEAQLGVEIGMESCQCWLGLQNLLAPSPGMLWELEGLVLTRAAVFAPLHKRPPGSLLLVAGAGVVVLQQFHLCCRSFEQGQARGSVIKVCSDKGAR